MKSKIIKTVRIILATVFLIVGSNACKTVKTNRQVKEKEFISLAYVSLAMLRLHKAKPEEVKQILDTYNWNGISDIALIGGIYFTGKDGSINTKWNKPEWPEVYEGNDYLGRPINEHRARTVLCTQKVIDEVVKYFDNKGLKIWVSQTAAGWLTGGSLGVVLESPELIQSYAEKLVQFTRQLGCVGIDFDWEFPPNDIQAEGYRNLMKTVKDLGIKVSVCAIRPTAGKEYLDQCIEPEANINGHAGKYMKWEKIIGEQIVDYINVMQYLGYNPESKQLDVKIISEKLAEWEFVFPN